MKTTSHGMTSSIISFIHRLRKEGLHAGVEETLNALMIADTDLFENRNRFKITYPKNVDVDNGDTVNFGVHVYTGFRKIVERNFANILQSMQTTMVYLEKIGHLRNPAAHLRKMNTHSKYLCLGICGEILNHIQTWSEGYRLTVNGFYCEFKFSVYTDQDNSEFSGIIDAFAQSKLNVYEFLDGFVSYIQAEC
jgi:hypothetical protein